MEPEKILSYGPRPELRDDKLSVFAGNFLSQKDIDNFYKLETLGVATHAQVTMHLNIITQLMWDEAHDAKRFQETGEHEYRDKMRDGHIKMTQFIYYTFSMILNPARHAGADKIENYADLERNYPVSADLGRITQLYDDVFDVMRDLHEEIHFNRPSGNAVLAAVDKKVGLTQEPGKLKEQFTAVYEKNLRSRSQIQLFSLPPEIKDGIAEVKKEYMEIIDRMDIPEIAKTVFRASFESMTKEGINPPVKKYHAAARQL